MFRVFSPLALCAVLLSAGCAFDPPATRTKIVTVEKRRTCTVTTRPEDVCATKKYCTKDQMTCAEAYYRLTVCGHSWLDGGTAIPREGQPNGIPCEDQACGKSAKAMTEAISKHPFMPKMYANTVCDPV